MPKQFRFRTYSNLFLVFFNCKVSTVQGASGSFHDLAVSVRSGVKDFRSSLTGHVGLKAHEAVGKWFLVP